MEQLVDVGLLMLMLGMVVMVLGHSLPAIAGRMYSRMLQLLLSSSHPL
jgi:hypothetical protein